MAETQTTAEIIQKATTPEGENAKSETRPSKDVQELVKELKAVKSGKERFLRVLSLKNTTL